MNEACERMHKECGDIIQTLACDNPPKTVKTDLVVVEAMLTSYQWSISTIFHYTLGQYTVTLVFERDILIPIRFLDDYNIIFKINPYVIYVNTRQVNIHHIFNYFQVYHHILVKTYHTHKHYKQAEVPFRISKFHFNDTVTIERYNNVI